MRAFRRLSFLMGLFTSHSQSPTHDDQPPPAESSGVLPSMLALQKRSGGLPALDLPSIGADDIPPIGGAGAGVVTPDVDMSSPADDACMAPPTMQRQISGVTTDYDPLDCAVPSIDGCDEPTTPLPFTSRQTDSPFSDTSMSLPARSVDTDTHKAPDCTTQNTDCYTHTQADTTVGTGAITAADTVSDNAQVETAEQPPSKDTTLHDTVPVQGTDSTNGRKPGLSRVVASSLFDRNVLGVIFQLAFAAPVNDCGLPASCFSK